MAKKLGKRVRFLFTGRVLEKVSQTFIAIFGTIWLFVESFSFFFQDQFIISRFDIFIFTIISSAIISLYISFPRLSYTRKYRKSNVEIAIEVGDLLDHIKNGTSHIVIGTNNWLDIQLAKPQNNSVKSQITRAFYGGRKDLLNKKILSSLSRKQIIGKTGDAYKVEVSSVATAEINNKKLFFLINQKYDHERQELYDTAKEDIWLGFCNLWTTVKSKGGNSPIAVPVLGSKVGRAPASRISLIQLILISFAIANRSVPITERLAIIIKESDYSPDEMFEISRFMDDLDL